MIEKLIKAVETATGDQVVSVHCHTAHKTTLRAQWDSRRGVWRIVKKTYNGAGGWKMFGNADGYITKPECESEISGLVEKFPDQYQEG